MESPITNKKPPTILPLRHVIHSLSIIDISIVNSSATALYALLSSPSSSSSSSSRVELYKSKQWHWGQFQAIFRFFHVYSQASIPLLTIRLQSVLS